MTLGFSLQLFKVQISANSSSKKDISCFIVCNHSADELEPLVLEVVTVLWEAVVCFLGWSCLVGGSTFAVVVHRGSSKDQVVNNSCHWNIGKVLQELEAKSPWKMGKVLQLRQKVPEKLEQSPSRI